MKKLVSILVFVILVTLLNIGSAFAGAWTLPKYKVWGEYYIKKAYAKDAFNSDWKLQSTRNTGAKNFRSWDFTMEPKLEYGVTDWYTAMFSLEYKEDRYKEYGRAKGTIAGNPFDYSSYVEKDHALTYIKFGSRVRLLQKPLVVSTQTRFFIYPNTYGINHGESRTQGVGTFYDTENLPSLGHGNDAVEQRLLIGKNFDLPLIVKIPCYFGAEAGYRWKNRGVCNDIPYFLEGGFWPTNWLLLKTELDGCKSHDGTGKFEEAYGIWRVGPVFQIFGGDSVSKQSKKLFNIELQYGMMLWGKNTTAYQEWVVKTQFQF